MKRFKRQKDIGLFDQDFRLMKLTELGDPLVRLNEGVDFEMFRELLTERLYTAPKGKGGRPPYDYVLMFKILVLQKYNNLSDDQIEFQINDRFSFMRFLGITCADDVPDSKTVWNFKAQVADLGLERELFDLFNNHLAEIGLMASEGKIIDASFIEVPKQRNTKEENKLIKAGEVPETITSNPNKRAQKDLDATWTKKGGVAYYGYKNHIKTGNKSKLIENYRVTAASVHDSQVLNDLLDKEADQGESFYADSAYTGPKQEAVIQKAGLENLVCEKGTKNKPLTDEQKEKNREKSKVRARVEHVFGFMEMSMNSMYLYSTGIKRVSSAVGLMNLTYNMFRKLQLTGI